MDQLNDLAVFVAVSEAGGFSAAAQRMGATTSGVSKSVGRFEERLGVRLFTRTTRRVALTQEGERLYQQVKNILELIKEAEEDVKDTATQLKGRVRIDLPVIFGQRFVLPLLVQFRQQNPAVDLDIRFNDDVTNLVDAGVDLALRFGALTDSGLKARVVGTTRHLTCAAPSYLMANGTPKSIHDLADHVCATYGMKGSRRAFKWRFDADGVQHSFEPRPTLSVDDGIAYRQLALSGLGLIQDLSFNFADDLQSGALVEVLNNHAADGPPISIVYPAGRHLPKRVRALIDYLVTGLDGFSP
jgi:LysR family transcriptional regulator, regulator for bpeEF and oprC